MKANKPLLSQVYAEWAHQWLLATKCAKNTRRAYDLELRRWAAFLNANRGVRIVTEELIQKFLDQLASSDPALLESLGVRGPLKSTSLVQSRRILGNFFLWLATERRAPAHWVMIFKRWQPLERTVDAPRRTRLITSHARTRKRSSWTDARHLLAQGLACWLGASPKELSAVQKSHVKVDRDGLKVLLPAGDKFVWRRAPDALKEPWIRMRHLVGNDQPVFASSRSRTALKASSIARLIASNGGTNVAPSGGANRLKRFATRQLLKAGMTQAELLHLFRRTRLPEVPVRLRKEVFEGSYLNQVLAGAVLPASRPCSIW